MQTKARPQQKQVELESALAKNEALEAANRKALAELEKHKAELARVTAGKEQELATERQQKEQALLMAQQKKLDAEKREVEAQLLRQKAENERLALLEAERKKADTERAELEASLRVQHEREVHTPAPHHSLPSTVC